ncbi:hypothetical protein ElyMa_006617500 [Elysia marginata]|uniref:Uncharacterized protein n=1 Tax=Elysia marginata TaxID=1093978 RepID=A0AAV4ILD9_9GAST|nr:hypothetical protein ElyMa_006617500 [Elysia marginata]
MQADIQSPFTPSRKVVIFLYIRRFSRGDRPPYVSISVMDGRSSGSSSNYQDVIEGWERGDGDDVDGKGGKGTSAAQKKRDEAQKRRLDKRMRVFVIDKDGQVKKIWKGERDSPDSGLEVV